MRFLDILMKKRNGQPLSKEEIEYFVREYTNDSIPDYQASAFLMTIFYEGMTKEELGHFTMAMAQSGEMIDLSSIKGIKVDKHSTGGVGDNITFVVTPLVASCGVPVVKMSGRGLGHTGGTVDKLEGIPNFQTSLSEEAFIRQVNDKKVAIVGQTGDLTPADKKIYALRDVTATVDSIPLIASSIMSKKLAAGADKIVLDVKVGSGAFMKTVEEAEQLARAMTSIGQSVGRETVAVLSNMDEPLGRAIGNRLEVDEAVRVLKGKGPQDVEALSVTLGAWMLVLARHVETLEEGKQLLQKKLLSGEALAKFREMIIAQGGDPSFIENGSLAQPSWKKEVVAPETGYIQSIDSERLGVASMILGAGRATKDDTIDMDVGLYLHYKVGDYVQKGERLLTIYTNKEQIEEVEALIHKAYKIGDSLVRKQPLIYQTIYE